MITIEKVADDDMQALLNEAKETNRENVYRSGPVYEQIKSDFHGKCYLCEDNEITSIQIEHFEPHKGEIDKKYDWNNLFFSCGHCNNLKGAQFWPLLNCTDPEDDVWESIEIRFTAYPKATVEIIGHPPQGKEQQCENTQKLLNKTLNGINTTSMKKDEAAIIRRKMLRIHNDLAKRIEAGDEDSLKELLSNNAPFTGVQRWTLRNEYPDLYGRLIS